MISAQGGNAEELLPGDTTQGDPGWSPDGTRIVFSNGLPNAGRKSDIRILDMKTRQVSVVPGSDGLFSPRWSPDGRYLVAANLETVSRKLLIFDFQTRKWSDWVSEPNGLGYPAWTADSRHVDYVGLSDRTCNRVRVGDTHPEVLYSAKGFPIYYGLDFGAWTDLAPDGSRMFLRDVSTQDIYALDIDFR